MTREQFTSLPLRIALGIIYDIARTQRLVDMPMPDVPKPPLYDGRLSKDGGFIWMSEMLLRNLQWWRKTKQESVDRGGQYAEKDAKIVATLDKWIAWRSLYPNEAWEGKRGDARVTAALPSRDPELQQWGPRSDSKSDKKKTEPKGTRAPAAADDGDGGDDYGF